MVDRRIVQIKQILTFKIIKNTAQGLLSILAWQVTVCDHAEEVVWQTLSFLD